MKTQTQTTLQAELAALFLLMLTGGAALLLLGWGRIGGPAGAAGEPETAARPGESPTFLPAAGGEWSVRLTPDDARSLMTLFFESLQTPAAGDERPPPLTSGHGACAPLFVTVYRPGGDEARFRAREGTLTGSVRKAAREFFDASEGHVETESLRVRLDVLVEARPFPVARREFFAARGLGEAVGAAVQVRDDMQFFLPPDMATRSAGDNRDMLRTLCRRAGLNAQIWRREGLKMWWLKTVGYVNDMPGSQRVLESPNGLVPLGEVRVSRLARASREGGLYLARSQEENGSFLMYRDPITGLRGGCRSLVLDASATAALAMQCEVWPGEEALNACHRGLSYAMQFTQMDAHDPRMAFTTSEEVCHGAWELEETAQVLEGLCRYARASGQSQPEAWIEATANFLLFMQRDDGLFELRYDPETGKASTPAEGFNRTVAQARGALALALAYRELGVQRFLQGAEAAVAPLLDESPSLTAGEARNAMCALLELHALRPSQAYAQYAAKVAEHRRKSQILPEEAPAPGLVGGTLEGYPPSTCATADDLTALAAACIMGLEEENLSAAERAAGYVGRLQFVPQNSYYLRDPEQARGAFREQPGSNLIKLQTVDAALRGLATLMRLRMQK